MHNCTDIDNTWLLCDSDSSMTVIFIIYCMFGILISSGLLPINKTLLQCCLYFLSPYSSKQLLWDKRDKRKPVRMAFSSYSWKCKVSFKDYTGLRLKRGNIWLCAWTDFICQHPLDLEITDFKWEAALKSARSGYTVYRIVWYITKKLLILLRHLQKKKS